MRDLISIIVPCFNEEEALPIFYEELAKEIDKLPCDTEVIFVDDGSRDRTPLIIKQLCAGHDADNCADDGYLPKTSVIHCGNSGDGKTQSEEERPQRSVRFVILSRNFGKEGAMLAGLREARGDYAVVMDADLQHPPRLIEGLYGALKNPSEGEHPESAACYRTRKGGKPVGSLLSRFIRKRFARLSGIDIPVGATDFRMVSRRMLDVYLSLSESNRFSKGLFNWIGFETKWIPYENEKRCAGRSSWSRSGLYGYGLEAILSFSDKPLKYGAALGAISCTLALILAIWVVIKTIIWGDPVAGFPSLFCMILFMGGSILLFLGLIGRYISKIYMETKHRPPFVTKETGGSGPVSKTGNDKISDGDK